MVGAPVLPESGATYRWTCFHRLRTRHRCRELRCGSWCIDPRSANSPRCDERNGTASREPVGWR